MFRSVPGAFYRVRTLDGVCGYNHPCIGPEVNPCDRKWLSAFQRVQINPQDMHQTLLAAFFVQNSNKVKADLGGHFKDDRWSLNSCLKYCRMLQNDLMGRMTDSYKSSLGFVSMISCTCIARIGSKSQQRRIID